LAARLDRRPEPRPPPGALKPDLAAAFVRVVPPNDDDVVLDPFAGSGALVRERARLPYGHVFATDIDPALAAGLANCAREGAFGPRATTARLDVRDAGELADLLRGVKVDVVLADPPWGLFAEPRGGVGRAAMRANGFEVEESFPVLVNGKKARVLVAAARDA
jgi:tRNA G10  N-methylase Trm11